MRRLILLVAALLFSATVVWAQTTPKLTKVDPETGKVGMNITVIGENLGKATVIAVFLSDAKDDFKASVVDQTAEKIVLKIPQVRAGKYNISIQVKNEIYIQPIYFTVED
jgi:hypothetical protein